MPSHLRTISSTLLTVAAMCGVSTSSAEAFKHETLPATFTAAVGAAETAVLDQQGSFEMIANGFPLACSGIEASSAAPNAGPEFESITLVQTYSPCAGVTITTNGCDMSLSPKTTQTESGEKQFTAVTEVRCKKAGESITIHDKFFGSTTCVYDVEPQVLPGEMQLTNKVTTPSSANFVEAVFNLTVNLRNTKPSPICATSNLTVGYRGSFSLSATDLSQRLVDLAVSG